MKSVQIPSFFWSVFSCIWTEYEETLRISLYSVQLRENTDQKKLRLRTFFTQCITESSKKNPINENSKEDPNTQDPKIYPKEDAKKTLALKILRQTLLFTKIPKEIHSTTVLDNLDNTKNVEL